MIALAVTTSTWRGGVAVATVLTDDAAGGAAAFPVTLASCEYEAADDHAERLFPTIEAALRDAGVEKRELSLLACDVGPGSFTGVRAATSAVTAIAWALGVPTVAVGLLRAMSWAATRALPSRAVLSVLDGRRQELYFAVHDPEGRELAPPCHLAVADVAMMEATRAEHDAVVVGEFATSLAGFEPVRAHDLNLPSAASIALMALVGAVPRGTLEPSYVRAPDAKTREQRAAAGSR